MTTNALKNRILAGLCLLGLAATAHAGVTARLQPQNIALGDSAQLAITVEGRGADTPGVPPVDGLDIVPAGQQTSMQIINGAMSSSATHLYRVTPRRAGSFTIPAIRAGGAGATAPVQLTVGQGSGARSLPAPKLGSSSDGPSVDPAGQSAFLRVTLPEEEMVVGELVPVEIKAYFRAGVSASLNGVPTLSSDAFALNKLADRPQQTEEVIDGAPYTVVTWTTSLSAVKAGEYPLNLDLPVMLRVREERRSRRTGRRDPFGNLFGGGSPFDDPFFQNLFDGVTEKPLTLHTDGSPVTIAALPTEGRPDDFSGAVGDFDIAVRADRTNGTVGDPLTLTTSITGVGNFSRVSTDGLPAGNGWKTYPANSEFHPADSARLSGVKVFEQSVVPTDAGTCQIPAVAFSYFDPAKEAYVTKTADPISMEIAPGTAPALGAAPLATVDPTPAPSEDGLVNALAGSDHTAASLRPLVRIGWFLTANAIVFGGLALAAIALIVRRRIAANPERLRHQAAEREIENSLAAMDAALAAKDAPRFFASARHAIQERLADKWELPAARVTLPEISNRLNGQGEDLRRLIKTAEEVSYSGRRLDQSELVGWRDLVRDELDILAKS